MTASLLIPNTVSLESEFVNRINVERRSVGLRSLKNDSTLTEKARSWSAVLKKDSGQNLGSECKLFDNPELKDLVSVRWKVLGENVACAESDVTSVHESLMGSFGHRFNILDPKFDSVGVGIKMSGNTMFVT